MSFATLKTFVETFPSLRGQTGTKTPATHRDKSSRFLAFACRLEDSRRPVADGDLNLAR
jgi:hypothetical protein